MADATTLGIDPGKSSGGVAPPHFPVAAMLARLMAANPLVRVQLESTDRRANVFREGCGATIERPSWRSSEAPWLT
jgi:DNA-binding transcriptional LysR family regulator